MEKQPKDYATPQERLKDQDWAGVVKEGVTGMTPGHKGWVLAFVVLAALILGTSLYGILKREETLQLRSGRLSDLLTLIENNRAEEIRRLEELIAEQLRCSEK
jgi:uncharacterized protein HemX